MSYVRLIAALALVLALVSGAWKMYHDGAVAGRAEVQALWDAERTATAVENAAKLEATRAKTTRLQATADKERGTLNAHILSIDLERDELLRRMRARPARPAEGGAGVPPDTGSGPGCTGASLFAPDSEFLTREAARADAIRARLASCESAYERAKNTVNPAGP